MCRWRAASANSIHKQERLINVKSVATHRKAGFEYFFFERFEAGLALKGSEIKSIRAGQISLAEAYVRVDDTRGAFLMEAHIAPYEQANRFNHDPKQVRRCC
jgi:SsrA-binding protein